MPSFTLKKIKSISNKVFRVRPGRLVLFVLVLAALAFSFSTALGNNSANNYDTWRAKLICNLIRTKFNSEHYSHKKIDDSLSEAAFNLYLKQLDYQKRFLLKADVEKLRQYADKIDDEINSGIIELPDVAAALIAKRTEEVQKVANDILDKGFDFNRTESLETDPEKRDFPANTAELRDIWRKILKYEVANRLLSYEELAKVETDPSSSTREKKALEKTAEEMKNLDPVAKAIDKVRKNYNETFDRMLHLKEQEQYDRYFDAFTRAFDPHSSYLPPMQLEDFDIHMKGSLEGIGARLQETDGYIKVISIIPGGAAARQGDLDAEDIILKVGEGDEEPVDIVGMRIRDAVGLIRGKKGTTVKLTVKKSDGRISVISIVRDVVNIEETFVKHSVIETGKGTRIGYILIPTFYRDFDSVRHGDNGRNATDDVRQALLELNKEKIGGLIVDLRNNGGGALIDAVEIAGLFIKKGPIVQIKEDNGTIRLHEDDDPAVYYNGPMLVLVNELSASASEILAGALQDYGRALIVGSQHTHGKGTVQALIDLDNSLMWPNMQKYKPLGALKVTIQKFYRVTGQSTQAKGVVPDIFLPDRMEYMKYGEKYIDYALPWDTIPATKFDPAGSFDTRLDFLKRQSEKRVAHNKKFVDIETQIEKSKERRENSARSLKLADIRRERDEMKKSDEEDAIEEHNAEFSVAAEDPAKKMTNEEKEEQWRKKVAQDPYVMEGENILADMRLDPGLVEVSRDR